MNPGSDNGELPTHLERLPERVAQSRRKNGLAGERTLVGLGHSAGASALLVISIILPEVILQFDGSTGSFLHSGNLTSIIPSVSLNPSSCRLI